MPSSLANAVVVAPARQCMQVNDGTHAVLLYSVQGEVADVLFQ